MDRLKGEDVGLVFGMLESYRLDGERQRGLATEEDYLIYSLGQAHRFQSAWPFLTVTRIFLSFFRLTAPGGEPG